MEAVSLVGVLVDEPVCVPLGRALTVVSATVLAIKSIDLKT